MPFHSVDSVPKYAHLSLFSSLIGPWGSRPTLALRVHDVTTTIYKRNSPSIQHSQPCLTTVIIMSFHNDFIDNSINDNKFNARKSKSTIHQLKKFIKPIIDLMKKNKNTYKHEPQPDQYETEINDNLANELLENEIFEEIDCCEEFSGINVYNNGHMDIVPVFRGQRYIPVHFARTEAGTFFWSSMVAPDCDINCHGDANPITHYQRPELQTPAYRWAQA